MDLTHQFTVPAGVNETWAVFNHPELIAPCFPGATLTSVDEHDFVGEMRVKLGPIALDYAGTGQVVERNTIARRTVIKANGMDKRGKGSISATITTSFSPNGAGTAVKVTTDLSLTGKPAQFGRGVIDDAHERLLAQLANCVSTRFTEGLGSGEAGVSAQADIGTPGAYSYTAPELTNQTDYDKFIAVAPVVAKRVGPAMLAGLTLFWVIRKFVKKSRP
jgi:uncharacterized protein